MIENRIKFVIEFLTKDSKYLTELAEKIQNVLTEIGVDCKNSTISIGVNYDRIEPYLQVIPFLEFADEIFFEYSCGCLNTRHCYMYDGIKLTTGYYDRCYSEEDVILKIKNRVRRFMITHQATIYDAHLNSRPNCDMATSKCLERHIEWVKDSIKYAKAVQKEAMAENEKVIELKAELELLRKGNQE